MSDSPGLVLTVRTEHDGAEVPLDEGLCGLDGGIIDALAVATLRRAGIDTPLSIDVLVTDDALLRRLNREYRGRDETTDVLSFPQLEKPLAQAPADQLWGAAEDDAEPPHPSSASHAASDAAAGTLVAHDEDDQGGPSLGEVTFVPPPDWPRHLGDVAISREAVARQAAAAGHSAAWELAFLLAHGILHLVGYDDHTEAGYAAMVAHQEAALDEVGVHRS
jgi:probable rRNA maturation factor